MKRKRGWQRQRQQQLDPGCESWNTFVTRLVFSDSFLFLFLSFFLIVVGLFKEERAGGLVEYDVLV